MHQEWAFRGSFPSAMQNGRCQVQRGKTHVENHFYDTLRLPQTFFPLLLSFLLYNFIDHLPMYSLKKNKYKNLFWTQKPKWSKAGKSTRKKNPNNAGTGSVPHLRHSGISANTLELRTELLCQSNLFPLQPLSSPRNRLAVLRCLRFPAYCRVCAGFEDTRMCVWTQSSQ